MTTIRITALEPEIEATIPLLEIFTGQVSIILPPLKYKLLELGLAGSDVYLGGKVEMLAVNIDLKERQFTLAQMTELIQAQSEFFCTVHAEAQKLLSERPLLG